MITWILITWVCRLLIRSLLAIRQPMLTFPLQIVSVYFPHDVINDVTAVLSSPYIYRFWNMCQICVHIECDVSSGNVFYGVGQNADLKIIYTLSNTDDAHFCGVFPRLCFLTWETSSDTNDAFTIVCISSRSKVFASQQRLNDLFNRIPSLSAFTGSMLALMSHPIKAKQLQCDLVSLLLYVGKFVR